MKIFNTEKLTRVSVVVPKKVFKKAHDRNRIKRRVNAIIYNQIVLQQVFRPNSDLLIFVRNNQLKTYSTADLTAQIQDLFEKAKARFKN